MQPIIAVLQISDAFSDWWPALGAAVGLEVKTVGSVPELSSAGHVAAVIVSSAGVEMSAFEYVEEVRETLDCEAAVVGVDTDYRRAVGVLRSGAADYFAMPADYPLLKDWMMQSVENAHGRMNVGSVSEGLREQYDFSKIVGRSPGLLGALDRTAKVIPNGQVTVLITGETGTGKELFAQAIHYNGPRAKHPFVEINCSALPGPLLESELFGYERGAFTDAHAPKQGLLEAASGGTLFLDEIGDLPIELQAKLLKVLDQKRVRRLGSISERPVDVRIIAATNIDLSAAVKLGNFRRDLLYRLSVVPIQLPPLRERRDDILLLAQHFLEEFARDFGHARPSITAPVRRALLEHSWPGNIRELRNVLERGVLLGSGVLNDEVLFHDDVSTSSDGGSLPFPARLEDIISAAAKGMIDHCSGNKLAAAHALGITRKRLYAILRRSDG